ncbi:hypothetical protein [Parapedobacter lycopersici]|uniref:hypothetical protein n=1 Tax=Parapedobacter lycopersici TaxID=1864939 RepID=UPI00214D8CB9|nr:hypothetical protein [Parapedobacter lycopersici]
MTNKTKAAIEEAARNITLDVYGHTDDTAHFYMRGIVRGCTEVANDPDKYGLGHKPFRIQEVRELVNQMLSEEISFSRFVELINEGGTK